MRSPTIKQVSYVIKKLKSVREQARKKGAFNMSEERVYNDIHDCGTVHCVAGWYAVANLRRKAIKDKIEKGRVDYSDGADLMSIDLGFTDKFDLKDWAEVNPKIWGNEDGDEMFDSLFSYDNTGFDGVIAQWELVKQNLLQIKKEK